MTCTVLVAEWGGIRNALGLLGTAEQADWHSASSRAPRALSPLETSGGGPFNHHRYARRGCRSERFVRQPVVVVSDSSTMMPLPNGSGLSCAGRCIRRGRSR